MKDTFHYLLRAIADGEALERDEVAAVVTLGQAVLVVGEVLEVTPAA